MGKIQLLIAAVMAIFSLVSYYGSTSVNPVTGEKQRVAGISPKQEVQMGLQAAREMAAQMGGLSNDPRAREIVARVGAQLAKSPSAVKSGYPYRFHVLADPRTVNAFALPGGQIFITQALLARLETEGQLAGVLAHEIGHVIARHSAERIAKSQFAQGLTGAFAIGTGSMEAAQVSSMVSQMLMLKYSREDEYEADDLGLRVMTEAGYDPRAMVGVMRILERASGGGGRIPERASTHPHVGNRITRIEQSLSQRYPKGIPPGLKS